MHGGVRETLAELRQKYWVCKGRQLIKKQSRRCVTCRRYQGKPFPAPTEADLPEHRVQLTRPFSTVGIDFCGPLFVKVGRNEMKKCYVALFTCSTTRALHFELVSDLSVATFILCMRRFVARRGKPRMITTDNAKIFKQCFCQVISQLSPSMPHENNMIAKTITDFAFALIKAIPIIITTACRSSNKKQYSSSGAKIVFTG